MFHIFGDYCYDYINYLLYRKFIILHSFTVFNTCCLHLIMHFPVFNSFLKGVKPEKKIDANGKHFEDYWASSKKVQPVICSV